jgi:hypothetical protein
MLSDKEQETVQRGLAAADLLAHPVFSEVIRSLTVEAFAVFTETKPSEKQSREDQYNLCQGLKAIEAELLARVQAKDALELKLNEDEEELFGTDDDLDNLED